jgi:hypothetical protein
MRLRSRKTMTTLALAGGLALVGVACEVEEGTSPGIEDPGVVDDGLGGTTDDGLGGGTTP